MIARKTVGQLSTEIITQAIDNTHSAEDQMREQLGDYELNIQMCIDNGCAHYPFSETFYVVVITKKERLMQNVLRNYFSHRLSCPTPEWDQVVYQYHIRTGDLTFLWVIPAKDICKEMSDNPLGVHESERELLNFVLDFNDGTLLKLAKKLNGEQEDSPLLER